MKRAPALTLGVVAASVTLGSIALAQRPGAGVSRECRREVVKLCGLSGGREGIRTCLTQKYQALSEECRTAILARASARAAASAKLPEGARELSFGSDPAQTLDLWQSPRSNKRRMWQPHSPCSANNRASIPTGSSSWAIARAHISPHLSAPTRVI